MQGLCRANTGKVSTRDAHVLTADLSVGSKGGRGWEESILTAIRGQVGLQQPIVEPLTLQARQLAVRAIDAAGIRGFKLLILFQGFYKIYPKNRSSSLLSRY